MAVVRYNPLVESMHGRIGNLVLQDIRGTHSARAAVAPRNPETTSQQRNRAQLGNASIAWEHLPALARVLWNTEGMRQGRPGRGLFIQAWCEGGLDEANLEHRLILPRRGTPSDRHFVGAGNPSQGQILLNPTVSDWPNTWSIRGITYLLAPDDLTYSPTPYLTLEFSAASFNFTSPTPAPQTMTLPLRLRPVVDLTLMSTVNYVDNNGNPQQGWCQERTVNARPAREA